MTEINANELLLRMEGETIDFKADSYDFSGDDKAQRATKRAEFVKDIVSMYNTPRDEPAYIILGVRNRASAQFG